MTKELNERIDALDDLDEAYDLMDELGVDTKGLKGVEDAKTRLRVHVSKISGGRKAQPSQDVIMNLLNKDKDRRKKIGRLCYKVRKFLGRMPASTMADLRKAFPNLDQDLDAVEKNLKSDKCAILIAGETSAGKSTLLNLLLGRTKTNLLPVAHLSVTSVICELKYGDPPSAVAHPWPDDKDARDVHINLSDQTADKALAGYVYQQTGRSEKRFPFQRVEIFWPSEWLRAGVTIVDSPGVGENEEMTNLVKQYMPKAFGFIYVINSANAGGVQEDRLEDLLHSFTTSNEPRKEEDEGIWQFDPRSAIFVANKWDCVPRDERQEVKDMLYSKLESIWSGLSRSQVFFLSASQALASMKEDVVNEDYGTLLDGIENLLPIGLTQAITKQFSQLSAIMKNATRILRTYMTQLAVSDMEREATCEQVMRRLYKIEERPRAIELEMKRKMNEEIDEGIAKAKAHLDKPNVIEYICKWTDDQCPEGKSMEVLEERIFAYALKRIQKELLEWDKENKIFEGIHQRLLAELKSNFLSLEAELERVENLMTLTDVPDQAQQPMEALPEEDIDDYTFSTKKKVILGLSAPIWIPLGIVVGLFALPVFGVKGAFKKRKDKKKLKEYNQNKANEMKAYTEILLDSVLNTATLKQLLAEKIGSSLSLINQMVSRIPDMIEADKQIVKKLKQQSGDEDRLLKELHPLHEEATIFEGKMDLLFLLNIKSYNINERDLGWNPTTRPLAQGNFAKVFKGSLVTPGKDEPIQCAVKILKDPDTQELAPLSKLNASEVWLEERNLRQLQHKHVVKYLGTALKTCDQGPSYLLMVMEMCSCSLESFIEDRNKYSPPADQKDDGDNIPLLRATDLAWQIADGIAGIHALGFLHRDLKPANILVTHDGQIKLADLGLAKREVKLTGTLAGTLLYMAPEVINNGRYNRSADMFSYGHILWEIWYGKNLSTLYGVNTMKAPVPGRRPEGTGIWWETMSGCWKEDPEARPTAAKCRDGFAEYKNTLKPRREY